MTSEDIAKTVAGFVGARLIAGDKIEQIVAALDMQLMAIHREHAIADVSVLTSQHYYILKTVADALRERC